MLQPHLITGQHSRSGSDYRTSRLHLIEESGSQHHSVRTLGMPPFAESAKDGTTREG